MQENHILKNLFRFNPHSLYSAVYFLINIQHLKVIRRCMITLKFVQLYNMQTSDLIKVS